MLLAAFSCTDKKQQSLFNRHLRVISDFGFYISDNSQIYASFKNHQK